jgi:hypothetical protein
MPHGILHDHPVLTLLGAAVTLIVLQNDKARIVAALGAFLVIVMALAQIVGLDLRL